MKGAFNCFSYMLIVFVDPKNLGIDTSFVLLDQIVRGVMIRHMPYKGH